VAGWVAAVFSERREPERVGLRVDEFLQEGVHGVIRIAHDEDGAVTIFVPVPQHQTQRREPGVTLAGARRPLHNRRRGAENHVHRELLCVVQRQARHEDGLGTLILVERLPG
jgi:hypothetical protein